MEPTITLLALCEGVPINQQLLQRRGKFKRGITLKKPAGVLLAAKMVMQFSYSVFQAPESYSSLLFCREYYWRVELKFFI